MPGLIGTGLQYRQQAEALASKSDELNFNRNQENKRMKAAKVQSEASLGATGAVVGLEATGSPWGALIGAGVGYLAGNLFS